MIDLNPTPAPWKEPPLLILPWSGRPIEPMVDLLGELTWKHGCQRLARGSSAIDWSRSALASEALTTPFNWWLWIDNDNFHRTDRIIQLVADAQEKDLDFLACIIPCRSPTTWANIGGDSRTIRLGAQGGIELVTHAGLALAVTHRRVFERIRDCPKDDGWVGWNGIHDITIKTGVGAEEFPGFPFFLPFVEDADYNREDISFCRRAIRAGSKLWADTSMIGKHEVSRWLGFEDIIRDDRQRKEQERIAQIEVD